MWCRGKAMLRCMGDMRMAFVAFLGRNKHDKM
jgi:hypothetical protein